MIVRFELPTFWCCMFGFYLIRFAFNLLGFELCCLWLFQFSRVAG